MCNFRASSPPSSPRPPARTRTSSSAASGNKPRKQYQQHQQSGKSPEPNNESDKIGTTSEQPNYVIHWPSSSSSSTLQLNSEGFLCWHSISELNNDAGTSLNEVSTLTSAMHSEFKCIFTKNFVKLIMRKNDVKRSSSSCIEQ